MPVIELITDVPALERAVDALRRARRIAVDTEGNSMHAYRNRLCLVQMCAADDTQPAETVYLVDPLSVDTLAPLSALLGPDGPTVVIHDLAFDARMLIQAGLPLVNVLDTALHARFLGLKETGLNSLLTARFGFQLDKKHQQDDWARRPLDDAQLAYLAADVSYLGPLAAALEAETQLAGITEEIAAETEYGLANARAEEPTEPSYTRLKGAMDLLPVSRAVLREMYAVRDAVAMRDDLPVGRVVPNASLLALAKLRPHTIPEVRKAGGLYDRGAALASELLAAIVRGEALGDVPEDEREIFSRPKLAAGEFAARRARENALTKWRRKIATERNVDMQVVLPGHALADIVRMVPLTLDELSRIPGLGDVRVARDGVALLATLSEVEAKRGEE